MSPQFSLKLLAALVLAATLALGLLPSGTIATRAEPALVHWRTIAIVPVELPSGISDRLRQDLSQRTKQPAQAFRVVQATRQTWSNGCLDLAKPDEICTEALVSGWRVVLAAGDRSWVYHTDQKGRIFRLKPATPGP